MPRRFHLERASDTTGMSGTGHVADGIRWHDGTASVIWLSPRPSIAFWYRIGDGMADAEWIHSHGGTADTRIVWDDPEPESLTPDDEEFTAALDAHLEATARITVLDPAHPLVQQLRGGRGSAGLPLVQGNCPACRGSNSLFLGDGGYVTCARLDCPEPDAATTLLEQQHPAATVPAVPAGRPAECGPECAEGHLYAYRCALKPPPADPAAILGVGRDTAGTVPDTDRTLDGRTAGQSRTPETPQASSTGQQDTTPDSEQDFAGPGLRKVLGVLLARVHRGVITDGEAAILGGHVEHLMRSLDQIGAERLRWQASAERMKREYDQAEAALARVRALREQARDTAPDSQGPTWAGLAEALDGPAAGQVDDSSPIPAAVVHPDAEQQANGTDQVDETPVTVEALAQLLSAADVEVNGAGYPTWGHLTADQSEQYRGYARYVLERCHVTSKEG
ncbi:hypothetical protein AB0O20_27605 [Streptomyces kronopolitis]|uniref:hypothetical protein n=1 Tax=Streptomyces kronopolitis TaxID=1612435 RepID=UPI00341D01B7